MAKNSSIFLCNNCGVQSTKWLGKCPSCNEWNTYTEEILYKNSSGKSSRLPEGEIQKPQHIRDISLSETIRIHTGCLEFNRVLGGGLIPGSLILIGGEPGIGKSTLLLQVALNIEKFTVLYISGEESVQQIKLRADRISKKQNQCYLLGETLLEKIFVQAEKLNPDILIIDSIQSLYTETLDSSPGTVSQIRECAMQILRYAKQKSKPVLLIGHITKDGNLAGPKLLEHIVDTVIQFEGDHHQMYRILRSTKNRFGSTSELGIFEMQETGLREVQNPSELLINQNEEKLSGASITAIMNGIRPFLVEIQALVSSAVYGTPQRSSTGFDIRRLNMLLAVLEKRAKFKLSQKDVFLNIAGGIKIDDPAADMGIITSIISSDLDLPVGKDICFSGEIGLSGEIRPVSHIQNRISEAEKLGFRRIFISKYNKIISPGSSARSIEIITVSRVDELFRNLFR